VELVWGFGRLRWEAEGVVIDHPLITIPAEVEQDDATQRIRVCPAGAPEVEARCLAGLALADRGGCMSIRESVNDEGLDPWDVKALDGVLRPLVRAIDHNGTLAAQAPPPGRAATADRSWVLFMRRRLPDYLGFLGRMRDLYEDESVTVPDTLQAIVSDTPSALAGRATAATTGSGAGAGSEPLLLPLPTNEEQERILAQAQYSTGVTVQGPPGTGKSHTIANIISHYVAYSQREDPRRDQGPDGVRARRRRRGPPGTGIGDRPDPDPGHRNRQGLRRRADQAPDGRPRRGEPPGQRHDAGPAGHP
jgi:hypothetical protein